MCAHNIDKAACLLYNRGMFRPTSPQGSLWQSTFQLSARKRRRLEQTWATTFSTWCLPLIDEEAFRPLYCADNGAPCKSVRLVVAVIVLRHLFDLTYAETQAAVDFDLRWHRALGLDPCDDADYVSPRTLQYFEAKLLDQDRARALFVALTDQLVARLGVRTGQQRVDSTHVVSDVARLSRLRLCCETLRVLFKALRREAKAPWAALPASLRARYLKDDGRASAYDDARASDSPRRLGVAARDAYRVREALRGVELPRDSAAAWALLDRLVTEHCVVEAEPQAAADGDADGDLPPVPVRVKGPAEIRGDSLQTPHDADVTYSAHKGQGHEVLLAETCDPANPVQLITHVRLERSCESDAARVVPTVEALAARGLAPETLLADTTFGSVANVAACAERGIDLVAPQPGTAGAPPANGLVSADAAFVVHLTPGHPPSRCPCGVPAQATRLNPTRANALEVLLQMPTAACAACARRGGCAALTWADGLTLVLIDLSEYLPARRRAAEQTEAFRERYAARAGIESTNSELKRGHGMRRLRVRGAKRVGLAVLLRALGCNLKRAMRYWGQEARNSALAALATACQRLPRALWRPTAAFGSAVRAVRPRWRPGPPVGLPGRAAA